MAASAKPTSGRPKDARLGQAIATACLLSKGGASLSVPDLQASLLTTRSRAEEILRMLAGEPRDVLDSSGPGESLWQGTGQPEGTPDPILPLYETGDGETYTRFDIEGGRRLLPLRLTHDQSVALDAALDRLGLPGDGGVRVSLRKAFWPVSPSQDDVDARAQNDRGGSEDNRSNSPNNTGGDGSEPESSPRAVADALLACGLSMARAQAPTRSRTQAPPRHDPHAQPIVTFGYRGDNDLRPRTRRVLPKGVRIVDGRWVVDAYDLDARSMRTFRAERMTGASLSQETASAPRRPDTTPDGGFVRLICRGPACGEVASWPGARVVAERPGQLTIEVPYYRGDWLPRHVLALGRSVTHDSELLTGEMADLARLDLERARELGV